MVNKATSFTRKHYQSKPYVKEMKNSKLRVIKLFQKTPEKFKAKSNNAIPEKSIQNQIQNRPRKQKGTLAIV